MGTTMIDGPVLAANRGEIAIRIFQTAKDHGLHTVAVAPDDDWQSPHVRAADSAIMLPGRGVAAYLDGPAIIAAARDHGVSAIHPGYGFLSENAVFAEQCVAAGIVFIGPEAHALRQFGDKAAACALARSLNIRTLAGDVAAVTVEQAQAFFDAQGAGGAILIKALAGGGGRGMRVVHHRDELPAAYAACVNEAQTAFGDGRVFCERFLPQARHIEVQIAGDGESVVHLWERDCSLQRLRQKIVEIAPAPWLSAACRASLLDAAMRLTAAANYRNLGTVEFLVTPDEDVYFIEANPRLQVEHTVTEEITGLDLVELQLRLAAGARLSELALSEPPPVSGMAMQMRINAETLSADGSVRPAGGELQVFQGPGGRSVRSDSVARAGYRPHPAFDTLLAKVIVHTDSDRFTDLLVRARRALGECRIDGIATNLMFLRALLADAALAERATSTRFVESRLGALLEAAEHLESAVGGPNRAAAADGPAATSQNLAPSPDAPVRTHQQAHPSTKPNADGPGAQIDRDDPLAVLAYGHQASTRPPRSAGNDAAPDDIVAPLQGTIVSIAVQVGDEVAAHSTLLIIESMKMEHELHAPGAGTVGAIHVQVGDAVWEGQAVLALVPDEGAIAHTAASDVIVANDDIRDDLAEVLQRRAGTRDAQRPDAVARRRKTGQRTARENVAQLLDDGTFIEYGPLVVAAQRRRRSMADLVERTPADGLITGVGRVNGELFDDPAARVAVMVYDYTVLAGTQGVHNHWKTDRILGVAERGRMPLILFGEGGGGRPGDIDYGGFVGQNTFHHFGRLSGLVPMVGIVSGRCFAGNAALMGACDVIIATEGTNLGMGGPAMIEGGGLGVFAPEEIGPLADQVANGVVDIAVKDETEAVATAKQYLAFFQGPVARWRVGDQRVLRQLVPENRLRVYDIRRVIRALCDTESTLEIRAGFGKTMVTMFARLEGKAIGVIANDPLHLGGAIDSDGADKAVRFMQLCDAFDIPLLYLCDTPGIMVGPEAERTALVRHASRMFVTGNNLTVPTFTVVLRKAYGLGAIAMAGGNFDAPYWTVSWPTGEFGPMGLEGQVKLGFRKELAAIEDANERRQAFDRMVDEAYQEGKAIERSTSFAIDDTIDPAETRDWLIGLLSAIRPPAPRDGKKRPNVDAW